VELNRPTRAEGPLSNLEEASVGTKTLSPRPCREAMPLPLDSTIRSSGSSADASPSVQVLTKECWKLRRRGAFQRSKQKKPTLSNSAGWRWYLQL
jgi:hypothetical protein